MRTDRELTELNRQNSDLHGGRRGGGAEGEGARDAEVYLLKSHLHIWLSGAAFT